MDYRNDSNLEDNNTIIYGHNMKNNTMFGSLQEYKNQDYYDNHKVMYYFTLGKNYIIELFTGYTISVESDIYDLSVIDSSKLEELISKSDFESNTKVTEENEETITPTTETENEKDETPKTGVNNIYLIAASLLVIISAGAILLIKKMK